MGGAVKNCRNNGTVIAKGNSTGDESYIGGVVGENYGTVADCCNTGAVTGSDGSSGLIASFTLTGGVVGFNTGKSSSIKNCCNTGTVTGAGDRSLTGGVVGFNAVGTVTNCRNSGDVTVTGSGSLTDQSRTGGVAGESSEGTIENCYNTGTVTGSSGGSTGGVVGDSGANNTIKNCYNTGKVTGSIVGGVAGRNFNGTVTNCYYLTGEGYPGHGIVYQTSDGGYTNIEPEPSWPTGGDSYDDSEPTYSPSLDVGDGGSIKVSPRTPEAGETVTITPTPEAGYDVGAVTVTDRNGREIQVTEHRNSTYTFTQPRGRVTISVTFQEIPPEPLPFTDVPADHWAYDAIQYVCGKGLMAGTGADVFSPDGVLTRGQLVTILWRLAGSPQVNYLMDFSDVDPAAWYGEAVRWASALKIAGGYGDGRFGPDDSVTREQLAVMLYQYAWNMGYDLTAGGMALREYDDCETISPWALEALDWAVSQGIVGGVSPTALGPQGQATRAQAAVMLQRFCEQDK